MSQPIRLFMFRLAAKLGKFVPEIEAIDSDDLSEWMAYERVETLADPGSWQQTARLCALVVAMAGGNTKKYNEEFFLPRYIVNTKKQTSDQHLMMLNAIFGGTLKIDEEPHT